MIPPIPSMSTNKLHSNEIQLGLPAIPETNDQKSENNLLKSEACALHNYTFSDEVF